MKSILIAISSYNPKPELERIVSHYQNEFDDCNLHFVIAANYTLSFKGSQIEVITGSCGARHAWALKPYLRQHFQEYDFVIETDDDILIPRKTFDNYQTQSAVLPLEFIPTIVSCETKYVGGMEEIFLLPFGKHVPLINQPVQTIKGERYFIPYYRHSAGYIIDKERFALALLHNLPMTPCDTPAYDLQEWARTAIYFILTPLVCINGLESQLAYHLPNKYVFHPSFSFRSLEEVQRHFE